MAQRGIVLRKFRFGRNPGRVQSGYSLHELLVTVSIAGSLASVVPTLRTMLQDNTLAATVNHFCTDLAVTRSEALRRRHTVTLCASPNGSSCDRHAPWQNGWVIFADPNDNGKLDAGETLIRVQSAMAPGVTMTFDAARNADHDLRYHATGSSEKNGTFTFCDSRGPAAARAIVLNFFGRPYISTRKPAGGPLECPLPAAS